MKKTIGTVLCCLGGVMLLLLGTMVATLILGTSDKVYLELQTQANVLETAGISEETLVWVDTMVAHTMQGKSNAYKDADMQIVHEVIDGEEREVFQANEHMHLLDCAWLFQLLHAYIVLFAISGCAMWIGGARLLKRRPERKRLSVWIAFAAVAVPMALFALLAFVNFPTAFTLFRRFVLRKNRWKLDAATDLLKRIFPNSVFAAMGLRIGKIGAIWIVALTLIGLIVTWYKKDAARKGASDHDGETDPVR